MITGRGNEIRSSSFFLLRYTVGLDTAENILIAFENTIRLSAHILIASAHALIVFLSATNKAATKRKHTPPQSLFFLVGEEITHCPPTVPSGDTPCLTAGDARRANPWESNTSTSDASGVAQQPQHLLLVFIFCCYIITSSLLEYSHLKTYTLRA